MVLEDAHGVGVDHIRGKLPRTCSQKHQWLLSTSAWFPEIGIAYSRYLLHQFLSRFFGEERRMRPEVGAFGTRRLYPVHRDPSTRESFATSCACSRGRGGLRTRFSRAPGPRAVSRGPSCRGPRAPVPPQVCRGARSDPGGRPSVPRPRQLRVARQPGLPCPPLETEVFHGENTSNDRAQNATRIQRLSSRTRREYKGAILPMGR